MAKRAPAAWSSMEHGEGSDRPRVDSPAGVRAASKRRRKRIDLNSNMTLAAAVTKVKRRTFANTHWNRLWMDEFIYTEKSVVVAKRLGIKGVVAGRVAHIHVSETPWALVSTLVSKDGHYPINSMGSQLALAAKLDVDVVEHEPKDIPTVEEFKALFAIAASAYGPGWRKRYLVKRIWSISGARTCLNNARKADPKVITMAIKVKPSQVDDLPAYVNYYRPV